jgi:hypothetical protein
MATPPIVYYEAKPRTKQYLCDYLLLSEIELDSVVDWFASRAPMDIILVGQGIRNDVSPQVLATLQSLRNRVSTRPLYLVRKEDYVSAVEFESVAKAAFNIDDVDMNTVTFVSHKWYEHGPDNEERSLQREIARKVSTEWIWIDHLCASSGSGADLFADVMNGCSLIIRGAQWLIHFGSHPHIYQHSAWCTLERLLIQLRRPRSRDVGVFNTYCSCKVRIFEPADWIFILCTLMSTRATPAESWEFLLRNVGVNTYVRFMESIREHLADCGYRNEMQQKPELEMGIFRTVQCLPPPDAEKLLLYISYGLTKYRMGVIGECLADPFLVDTVRFMESQIERCDVPYSDPTGELVMVSFHEWRSRYASQCTVQFVGARKPNSITLPDNWSFFNLLQLCYYAKAAQISYVVPKGTPLDREVDDIWGASLPTLCHLYCGILRSDLTRLGTWGLTRINEYMLPYHEDWFIFWLCLAVHCGGFVQAAQAILDLNTFAPASTAVHLATVSYWINPQQFSRL